MLENLSPLHTRRLTYRPKLPPFLLDASCEKTQSGSPRPEIARLFPKTASTPKWKIVSGHGKVRKHLRVGVLFSGGQAAGGHNVLWGLYDGLPDSTLLGFMNGASGLIDDQHRLLDRTAIESVRNQGGFDLIGSGRTKIETEEQFNRVIACAQKNDLDAIVVIGGDDSNTNAALLAEKFLAKGLKTCVIGVPKTIDGDLRSPEIEISFGFDSACRTYSEMIGNIARDALSAKKYTHFIKLMGRSASHITLECALQTHPNLALIGEEGNSLDTIIQTIATLIQKRAEMGKNYGLVLLPEGLVEFIPEIKELISALNQKQPLQGKTQQIFERIPEKVRAQFTLAKDPHGNIAVSQIETEQLLMSLVNQELQKSNFKAAFHLQEHFFGYEGRACLPTNFDCTYCYALGRLVALGIHAGATGVIAAIQGLKQESEKWSGCFIPLVQLMDLEERNGKLKPVIQKTLVDLRGAPYNHFKKHRDTWALSDSYRYPGPIQFEGDRIITDLAPLSISTN